MIKSHQSVFGRESLSLLALRSNAYVAINGGFFEIGQERDGMPSGTLIIEDKIFGLKFSEHACLILNSGKLSFEKITNIIKLSIANEHIQIKKVNQFANKEEIILYTPMWGDNTLTSFQGRKEVAIDKDGKILNVYNHGNGLIPRNGFVVSFPESINLSTLEVGKTLSIDFSQSLFKKETNLSAVMGIPLLIVNRAINPALTRHKSSFFDEPHARTAIGIKPNGDIVLVIVEHAYIKPLEEVTMEEIKNLLEKKQSNLLTQYKKLPYDYH